MSDLNFHAEVLRKLFGKKKIEIYKQQMDELSEIFWWKYLLGQKLEVFFKQLK